MNGTLGHAGVILGFLAAVAGVGSLAIGILRGHPNLVRQGHSLVWLVLIGAVVATISMEHALLTHDFTLQYVADNNSRHTPLLFTIAGMWAALEGSILLWGLILSVYITTMAWYFRRRRRDDAMVGWATAVALVVAAFFFGLMLDVANPFATIAGGVAPVDGKGPNPLLQNHVLMAFHPPILYAGYVGFTIPFAFGMAALITGRLGEGWLVQTRRWTLIAWGFLSAGIVLGSWWSYEVLGWGGYWSWDPVENASFLPWLTGTAFLHSVMVQERRGMLRVWNLSLLSATFALTILGTFFTRSGVLESVHAFSESPLGPWLISAFAVVVVSTCALVFWRGDRLGSPGSITSPLSREAAFLANNVAFAAFAFVVLLGTVFPLLAEAINNESLSVGSPYFNQMTRPIGLVLLFLMAMAPVLPWRGAPKAGVLVKDRITVPFAVMVVAVVGCVVFGVRGFGALAGIGLGTFVAASSLRQLGLSVRARGVRGLVGRSSGGMVAHLGLAMIAVAIVVSQSYVQRNEYSLVPGQTVRAHGHDITLVSLQQINHPNRTSMEAIVRVDGGDERKPALSTYPNSTDAIGTPSVQTSLREDVYLTLVRTPSTAGEPAVVSVVTQPMVSWLWIGGFVIVMGTVLALIPGRRPSSPLPTPAVSVSSTDTDTDVDRVSRKEPVLS